MSLLPEPVWVSVIEASGCSGTLDLTCESMGSSNSLLKEEKGSASVGEWLRRRMDHLKFQMLSPWESWI